MMLPRHKGSVAEWSFKNGLVKHLTWSVLERSLTSCATVSSVLRDHRLLFPNSVRLSQWMQAGESEVAQSKRIEKADINISVYSSKPFVDIFLLCRLLMDKDSVYPLTIEVFGSGTIVTDRDNALVEDLVWVRATTLDIFSISVATQSDVWLPFSLQGEPQHDTSKLNANRLETALQEIQKKTCFDLEEGIESYYSVINGFRIYNVRYADGSIADVS